MSKLRERTTATLLIAIFMISAMIVIVPALGTTINEGVLTYATGHHLEGELLKVGYDIFGYNYQGHMFNGYYCNAYLGRPDYGGLPPYEGDADAYLDEHPEAEAFWFWPYRDVKLMMKWNDAWLSNEDNDNDGKLDKHYGHTSFIGSGAWLTNHQSGRDDGVKWTYFTKIVAVPIGAEDSIPGLPHGSGMWSIDGTDIGPEIWGAFATIQTVYNEKGVAHGIEYLSPSSPGFGYYQP